MALAKLFFLAEHEGLGLFLVACVPGGGAGHLLVSIIGADRSLSISINCANILLAVGKSTLFELRIGCREMLPFPLHKPDEGREPTIVPSLSVLQKSFTVLQKHPKTTLFQLMNTVSIPGNLVTGYIFLGGGIRCQIAKKPQVLMVIRCAPIERIWKNFIDLDNCVMMMSSRLTKPLVFAPRHSQKPRRIFELIFPCNLLIRSRIVSVQIKSILY